MTATPAPTRVGSGAALILCAVTLTACCVAPLAAGAAPNDAQGILAATGVKGGLIVHIGCGDGRLTAALRINERYIVHGLDRDAAKVAGARTYVRSLGLSGPVSFDHLPGRRLPYVDGLVNLLVADGLGRVPMAEVLRVLAPRGVAYVKEGGSWKKTIKERPSDIDEWTHFLHDSTNNAVAHDRVVGPPRHVQWISDPKLARQHDHLASITTVVSSRGRIFYIADEAPAASILLSPKWSLIARDAFNGVLLWKREITSWHPHLWSFREGPPALTRRLVSIGDRVYVTLGYTAPLVCLDAATGKTLKTYEGTAGTQEVLYHDGTLVLALGSTLDEEAKQADRERQVHELLEPKTGWAENERGDPWDMSQRSDVEGTGHVKGLTFEDGVMSFSTEVDPIMVLGRSGKLIDAAHSLFAVRMYASRASVGQVYYWSPDGDWQGFVFGPVRKGWHTYYHDVNAAKHHGPGGGSEMRKRWGGKSGKIHKLRFDPVNEAEVEVKVDWIKLIRGDDPVKQAIAELLVERHAVVALDAATGREHWRRSVRQLMPTTLAVAGGAAFLQTSQHVMCVDLATGEEKWRKARPATLQRPDWSAPTLVVHDGVVLCADRVTEWKPQRATRKVPFKERLLRRWPPGELVALSAQTGDTLWTTSCYEGYHGAVDVFVIDDTVWIGQDVARHGPDFTEGRDPRTGKVKKRLDTAAAFTPDHHHRCYRNKATDRYIVLGRTGIEFIDMQSGECEQNTWVRGGCQYGVLPCNGLIYAPSHSCACYIQSKVNGFLALTPSGRGQTTDEDAPRLRRGPAYGKAGAAGPGAAGDWPTYRHDARRSGCASTALASGLEPQWRAKLGGRLTSPVVASGLVFVARIDAHTVHALDAESGRERWCFTAGGRVDSPPTVHEGQVLFGCADGWVYCLRSRDGALAWQFRAAPRERKVVAFERVESAWPVHGSVLVEAGAAYCVAGRSSYLDDGLFLYKLHPATGERLSESRIYSPDPATGKQRPDQVKNMNMAGALPDIMSGDGQFVYMRHQRIDGQTLKPMDSFQSHFEIDPTWPQRHKAGHQVYQNPERGVHLFSPTGFLDDSWWHRSYWVLGTFFQACCPYFTAAVYTPAGRILVHDDEWVYGFARQPRFWGWWTPLEYHLFAASTQTKLRQKGWRKKRFPDKWQGIIRLGTYGTRVPFRWKEEVPFHVRAMVLTEPTGQGPGKTLFIAGPPDVLDETEVDMRELMRSDARTREVLDDALAAWEGKYGARLWAVSTSDGGKRAEYELDSLPVFDGMIAAEGRLVVSLADGSVLCMAGSP